MSHFVAPSLLSADFGKLSEEVEMINNSDADWLHLDIMDGNFVPNISFGFPVVKSIAEKTKKPLDVHLMIQNPDNYIQAFRDYKAHVISVHYEACTHLNRTISFIKQTGALAGVAINPHTPIHLLEDIITDIDLVLLMSVNPGFGGQKYIERSVGKIIKLKELIENKQSKALIEVDGGIGLNNAAEVIAAGANVLVAGNSIFSADNPEFAISELKNIKIL